MNPPRQQPALPSVPGSPAMVWLHPPAAWRWTGGGLQVTTAPDTDFWQRTHYGFIRDSGHHLATPMSGDFTASVCIAGDYRHQYDQAGLMVRLSDEVWVKAGIEFVDGVQRASVVVTRTYSDWSVAPLDPTPDVFWIRIAREGGALTIDGSVDGQTWELMRIAWLTDDAVVEVGPMCASPDGSGFPVTFRELRIEAAN